MTSSCKPLLTDTTFSAISGTAFVTSAWRSFAPPDYVKTALGERLQTIYNWQDWVRTVLKLNAEWSEFYMVNGTGAQLP